MHSDILAGNALEIATNTRQLFNMQVRQNPAANGDQWTQGAYLKAGTWKMFVLHQKLPSGAICELTVHDGTISDLIATMDTYAAGGQNNQSFGQVFTIRNSGWHWITGRVTGRNASNTTGWNVFITMISMVRTGD